MKPLVGERGKKACQRQNRHRGGEGGEERQELIGSNAKFVMLLLYVV